MNEHVYITETGELVCERDGFVEIGLSPEAQVALGHLLHLHVPKEGKWVEKGDHLFVVEGTFTAAEFYAPVSGRVVSRFPQSKAGSVLVAIRKAKSY